MTERENPFALKARQEGPEPAYLSQTLTPEEQAKKLLGYMLVPPDFWADINYGKHVRYYRKTGEFRSGFVASNPVDMPVEGTQTVRRVMKLKASMYSAGKAPMMWNVGYEDVDRFFVKMDIGDILTQAMITDVANKLNANIRTLAEAVRGIQAAQKKR